MTDRPVMTEAGLSVLTVLHSDPAGVALNTNITINEAGKGNLAIKEILSAALILENVAPTALTVVKGATAPIGAGNIQLVNENTVIIGSNLAAGGGLLMHVQATRHESATGAAPEAPTASPKMTEHSLDIFTIVYTGVAHAADATWNIPASFRAGLDIGELVAGFITVLAGGITALTVLAPGTGNPGAGNMRLETTAENNIKVGTQLLITGTLVLYCRAGKSFGALTGRPAMTEKGLSEMLLIYAGGNQAGGPMVAGAVQAIPPAIRAGHEILEIISAEIHDLGIIEGTLTPLTVVTTVPTGDLEIYLASSTTFTKGMGGGTNVPLDSQIWMHVRVVDAQI